MNARFDFLFNLLAETADHNWFAAALARNGDLPALLARSSHVSEVVGRARPNLLSVEVSRPNQVALARKLLLGRRADLLRTLLPFWAANGTDEETVRIVVAAAEQALNGWPGRLHELRAGTAANLPFNSAYAEFSSTLGRIEQVDRDGPIGEAVGRSRYAGAAHRTPAKPYLRGESQRPVGFPVLLGRDADDGGWPPHLSTSAWVEPTGGDEWPAWLSNGVALESAEHADVATKMKRTRALWNKVTKRVATAVKQAGYDGRQQQDVLPEWYLLYIARWDVESFDSAGLALAMQSLAAAPKGWPLPAGVGFTGRWDAEGRLAAVSGLAGKMRAARETGVFALFACADRSDVPTDTVVNGEGVELILLPAGLGLAEIVRLVNTACAALGLTHDRWEFTSERQQRQCRPAQSGRGHSRLLTDAHLPEALPVGFVGREDELGKLTRWKHACPTDARAIGLVEGAMRAGKTTLLAHWLHDAAAWPTYPVWFSCVRGHNRASRFEDVRSGLACQIQARLRLLPLPTSHGPSDPPGRFGWPNDVLRTRDATRLPIDIALDGLDEAVHADQARILDLVSRLPGGGVTVVGSQQGTPALTGRHATTFLLLADRHAACRLVEEFGRLLRDRPETTQFGQRLDETDRQNRLAERAGDNLWILTRSLEDVLERPTAAPESPEALPLCSEVSGYVSRVLDEILERYPAQERAKLRDFIWTLAMVDLSEQAWAPSDLLSFAPLRLGADALAEACEGPLGRMLTFRNGGVCFRDVTFRQVVEAKALGQDRTRGRPLAEALVKVLSSADSSSPFLTTFATTFAAQFVLEHAAEDSVLAASLLLSSWVSRRFHELSGRETTLAPLLDELNSLLRLTTADEAIEPLRELLACLVQWQAAIETGTVSATDWWRNLAPIRAGRIPGHQSHGLSVPFETSKPMLLAPLGGYGPTAQALWLTSAGCALGVGAEERLVLAGMGGRIVSFARKGDDYSLERVINVPSGTPRTIGQAEVVQLEPLDGGLALAVVQQHPHPDLNLFLVDLDAPSPRRVETPPGLQCVTVLKAEDGHARIVMFTQRSAETQEMRIYQLSYARTGPGRGTRVTPVSEADPVPIHGTVWNGTVWRPRMFANNTWAAQGRRSSDALAVYQARGDDIKEVTSPNLHAALRGYKVHGVCPVHDERLAVVVSPCKGPDAENGVYLLVVGKDGALPHRIRLDSESAPEAPMAKTASADNRPTTGAGEDLISEELQPLGWHGHFGLLLGSTVLKYAIALEQEALLRSLPAQIDIQSGNDSLCGAVPLAGDRLLLVYDNSALVLGPEAAAAVVVYKASSSCESETTHAPVENGLRGVGPTGVRVWASGSRLFASDGRGSEREVADLGKEFRNAFDGIQPVEVKHALCIDDDNWACGVLAQRLPPGRSDAEGDVGEDQAATDLVIVGCSGDGSVYLPITDVPPDCECRIEALANGLIGFRYGCVNQESDCTGHPLHLYDLVAKGLACPHADAEVGAHDVSYEPPLLDVSPEWVLLLGSPYREASGDFAVYQYPFAKTPTHRQSWHYASGDFAAYQYRVGSLERPSRINGLRLTNRAAVVDRSPGRVTILELGPFGARVRRFSVDREFGIVVPHDEAPQIKLDGDGNVLHIGGLLVVLDHGYESQPYRVEVVRLPTRGEESPLTVAVGYLSEEPWLMWFGPGSLSLGVQSFSGVTWFDLTGVPGIQRVGVEA